MVLAGRRMLFVTGPSSEGGLKDDSRHNISGPLFLIRIKSYPHIPCSMICWQSQDLFFNLNMEKKPIAASYAGVDKLSPIAIETSIPVGKFQ